MKPVDLAWAAGVFEGEGSIRINPSTKRNNGALLVDMVNTDPEMVQFFQTYWPGYMRGPLSRRGDGNWRDYYRYRSAAWVAARFLTDVLPYLRTERMRGKAELGLAYQAQKSKLSTVNRTPEYRARQVWFYEQMAALNLRGAGTEPCPQADKWRRR